jgi:hypothetical protein
MIIRLLLESGTNVTQVPDRGKSARLGLQACLSKAEGPEAFAAHPDLLFGPCRVPAGQLFCRRVTVSGWALTHPLHPGTVAALGRCAVDRAELDHAGSSTASGTDRRAGRVRLLKSRTRSRRPARDARRFPARRLGARHLMPVPVPRSVSSDLTGREPAAAAETGSDRTATVHPAHHRPWLAVGPCRLASRHPCHHHRGHPEGCPASGRPHWPADKPPSRGTVNRQIPGQGESASMRNWQTLVFGHNISSVHRQYSKSSTSVACRFTSSHAAFGLRR